MICERRGHMCTQPLPLEIFSDLATDFEESNLPFKVDIVDWNTISDDFRLLIDSEKMPFTPTP